jgi:hypothetical protein
MKTLLCGCVVCGCLSPAWVLPFTADAGHQNEDAAVRNCWCADVCRPPGVLPFTADPGHQNEDAVVRM